MEAAELQLWCSLPGLHALKPGQRTKGEKELEQLKGPERDDGTQMSDQ